MSGQRLVRHDSFICKRLKLEATQMHMNRQIDKQKWYCIYTVGYYSVIQRNELFIHMTTWLGLGIVMLRERSYPPNQKTVHIV